MQRSPRFRISKKTLKRLSQFIVIAFLILNFLAFTAAYGLTHFTSKGDLGFGLPRPSSSKLPSDIQLEYVTHRIPINASEWLEAWLIPVQNSRGTVLLFPGNAGSKANQLLAPAQAFHNLGYDTLLCLWTFGA